MYHFFLARSEKLEYCFNVETTAPLDAKELTILRHLLATVLCRKVSLRNQPTLMDARWWNLVPA